MNELMKGTLVTMRGTYKGGHVERTYNTTSFQYDIRLDDGTLVKATSDFWHSVPSVLTKIADIPDLVSAETGKPIEAMPGLAFIDFYYSEGEDVEIRWKKYRELYPAEAWGVTTPHVWRQRLASVSESVGFHSTVVQHDALGPVTDAYDRCIPTWGGPIQKGVYRLCSQTRRWPSCRSVHGTSLSAGKFFHGRNSFSPARVP